MKNNSLLKLSFVILSLTISCNDEVNPNQESSVSPITKNSSGVNNDISRDAQNNPIKEEHYNFDDMCEGLMGEKLFTYDEDGNLLKEHYNDIKFAHFTYEINNEYDTENRIIKSTTSFPGVYDHYYTRKITYENGLKILEERFQVDAPIDKLSYYYTANLLDSIVSYYYDFNKELKYNSTTYYKYDSFNRVVVETKKFFLGDTHVMKINTYENNLLVSVCNPVEVLEGVEQCTRNEYNSDDNLIKIYSTLTSKEDKLQEEFSYKDGVLNEKKVYDLDYPSPDGETEFKKYTLLVKYKY